MLLRDPSGYLFEVLLNAKMDGFHPFLHIRAHFPSPRHRPDGHPRCAGFRCQSAGHGILVSPKARLGVNGECLVKNSIATHSVAGFGHGALNHDTLEGVQNGGMAVESYKEAIASNTTSERKQEIRRQLLQYCKLDTFAMVMLYQFFNERESAPSAFNVCPTFLLLPDARTSGLVSTTVIL